MLSHYHHRSMSDDFPLDRALRRQAATNWDLSATWWARRLSGADQHDDMRDRVLTPYLAGQFASARAGIALDIGCGEGYALRQLHALGWRTVGMDWSPRMALSAARTAAITAVVADAEYPFPLRDGAFDAILATMVLMDIADVGFCLREARRVARNSALAEFVIPHPDYLAQSPNALAELRERVELPDVPGWRAWVRMAPEQPAPTLYYHRPEAWYRRELARSGWTLVHAATLTPTDGTAAASTPKALAFSCVTADVAWE